MPKLILTEKITAAKDASSSSKPPPIKSDLSPDANLAIAVAVAVCFGLLILSLIIAASVS